LSAVRCHRRINAAFRPRLNRSQVCRYSVPSQARLATPIIRTGFSRSGLWKGGASLITVALTEGGVMRGRSEPSFASWPLVVGGQEGGALSGGKFSQVRFLPGA
jgi:hypothetical protein